jgi:hypothetical protein
VRGRIVSYRGGLDGGGGVTARTMAAVWTGLRFTVGGDGRGRAGCDGSSGPGGGLNGSIWIWLRDTIGSLALFPKRR